MRISHILFTILLLIWSYAVNCGSACHLNPKSEEKEENLVPDNTQRLCFYRPPVPYDVPSDKKCYHAIGVGKGSCRADGPRCDNANNMWCLPIPYDGTEYALGLDRIPLSLDSEPPFMEYCPNRGVCRQDGDCYTNGCGNHCTSYDTANLNSNCPRFALQGHFCGCVRGRCVWFRQCPEGSRLCKIQGPQETTSCVDIFSNSNHCNGCGNQCLPSQSCVKGNCR